MRHLAGMDLGRGCPYLCSFCTIINVHGRKMRQRSVEAMTQYVRENHANGIRHYFITDDNVARNPLWEDMLDELIRLRNEENICQNMSKQVVMSQFKKKVYRLINYGVSVVQSCF